MIIETEQEIKRLILNAICEEVNSIIPKITKNVLDKVKEDVVDGLKNTYEYNKLTQGSWRGIFGFEEGYEESRVDAILYYITESIRVEFIKFKVNGSQISGGLFIKMLIEDYSDIIDKAAAIVVNNVNIYEEIPWLELFLTKGGTKSSDYGVGYRVYFGDYADSRSKIAIMAPGTTWVIPGDGSASDNWFTRFFSSPDFKQRLFDNIKEEI